mgnify:CR=1 FL=1
MTTRQATFAGMEAKAIPELTKVAEEYEHARDARIKKLRTELELKEKLLELMHKHKQTVYRDGDLIVLTDTVEKVKVKRESDEEEE